MTFETCKEEISKAYAFIDNSEYDSAKNLCFSLLKSYSFDEKSKANLALKAQIYNVIAEIYLRQTDLDEAYNYATEAEKYATNSQSYFEQTTVKYILAQCYINKQEYYKALECIYEGLEYIPNDDIRGLKYFGYIHLSNVYSAIREYSKSLDNLLLAQQYFESINKPRILGKIYTDIAEVYSNLEDRNTSLFYLHKALDHHRLIGYERGIAFLNLQLGLHYIHSKSFDTSLQFFSKSLEYFEEFSIPRGIGVVYTNMGDVYFEQYKFEEAYEIYQKAIVYFEQVNDSHLLNYLFFKKAKIYSKKQFSLYDFEKAEKLLLDSVTLFKKNPTQVELKEVYFELVNLYKEHEQWKMAFLYFELYNAIEIEVAKNKSLLEIRNNEFKNKMQLTEKEKVITERLLSQMLPTGIASKLLKKQDVSEQFDICSIMFIDLVGYTKIADSMTPENIFTVLNSIMGQIDSIVSKNQCERLKTIGDCYVAMCGIPISKEDHTVKLATAAIDIMNNLKIPFEIKQLLPDNYSIEFRIGIHCGSVSAGIIGTERFQYDVYGDTVNVASRLETQGEPGRIHISEEFAKSIEANPEFFVIPRGEISIKGKGTMNTYWLEKAK